MNFGSEYLHIEEEGDQTNTPTDTNDVNKCKLFFTKSPNQKLKTRQAVDTTTNQGSLGYDY